MTKLVFVKKDKKNIFKHPRRTNYFLSKRRTCPPKRGRMVTLYYDIASDDNTISDEQLRRMFDSNNIVIV